MPLLAVLPHLLDILGGMLADARDIPVGADNNVILVFELRIGVWSTAAKTVPSARWSTRAACRRPSRIGRVPSATLCVTSEHGLRLAWECRSMHGSPWLCANRESLGQPDCLLRNTLR